MLDQDIIATAQKLKKIMDATYLIFKKDPTKDNARRRAKAAQAFANFCKEVFNSLITDVSYTEEILNNLDSYQTCKQCDAELIYLTSTDNYVSSFDFIKEFPGWCYSCLVKHCATTDCKMCMLSSDANTCPLKWVDKVPIQYVRLLSFDNHILVDSDGNHLITEEE